MSKKGEKVTVLYNVGSNPVVLVSPCTTDRYTSRGQVRKFKPKPISMNRCQALIFKRDTYRYTGRGSKNKQRDQK